MANLFSTTAKTLTIRGQRMKNLNTNVYTYILDCIDSSGYEIKTKTESEKLQFLADIFKREYGYKENIKYYGSYQKTFANWLMGLPSSFNVDYENYKILQIAVKWESLPVNYTEKQADNLIDNWFMFIASKTEQLCRKHKINLYH